jgi:hypothetical protein
MPRRTPIVAVLLAVACAEVERPDDRFVRLDGGSCVECQVSLRYVVTVGSPGDAELIQQRLPVVALSDGSYVVPNDPLPLHFAADGSLIGALGVEGDGPGELRGGQAIARGNGDSVIVFGYGKAVVVSGTTGGGRTAQSSTRTRAFQVAALPDGQVFIPNYFAEIPPFVVMDAAGEATAIFGDQAPEYEATDGRVRRDYDWQQYAVAPSPQGGVWAASQYYRYGLTRWSADGTALQSITAVPPWWHDYDRTALNEANREGFGRVPRLPSVLGISVTGEGLLVVSGLGADADWRADPTAPEPYPRGREGPPKPWEPVGGIERYLDWNLDLYDEATGEWLGSWRSDAAFGNAMDDGKIYEYTEDENGVLTFDVWQLEVTGR